MCLKKALTVATISVLLSLSACGSSSSVSGSESDTDQTDGLGQTDETDTDATGESGDESNSDSTMLGIISITQTSKGNLGTVFEVDSQARFFDICLLYTSPSPRDATLSRMPSSA